MLPLLIPALAAITAAAITAILDDECDKSQH